MQMDGVKLALGGANAAADALVGVHYTGAAAQAAGGLGPYLRFGQRQVGIPEGTVRVDARISAADWRGARS